MEQQIALWITLGSLAAVTLAFLYVIKRSTATAEYPPIQEKSSTLRKRIFILTVLVVVPVMLLTLTDMPYAKAMAAKDAIRVNAVGKQWSWTIEPNVVPAGKQIVFSVTSDDVNHGFGIYDASMRLVAQTQAMPGYVNELTHTFEKPGTYKVLCLEFCGSAHHVMAAEITVSSTVQE